MNLKTMSFLNRNDFESMSNIRNSSFSDRFWLDFGVAFDIRNGIIVSTSTEKFLRWQPHPGANPHYSTPTYIQPLLRVLQQLVHGVPGNVAAAVVPPAARAPRGRGGLTLVTAAAGGLAAHSVPVHSILRVPVVVRDLQDAVGL